MDTDTGWSRDLLYQMVDSVREYAIFASDAEGTIVSWNPGVENVFGFVPEEFIGQNTSIIFTPEDRERNEPVIEMQTAARDGFATDERWHIRKDGSRVFCAGIQTALREDSGEVTGFVKIARDLSERINLETELRYAMDMVDTLVNERGGDLTTANDQLRVEVTDRKRSEELRTALLRKIVTTQEAERKRISREIHDHIGQQLTALKLKLTLLAAKNRIFPLLIDELSEIQSLANQVDADLDFLAWELRPASLDDIGLTVAAKNFVRDWSKHFDIEAEFRSANLNDGGLPPEVAINIYRILQEALNNTFKHGEASKVSVILEEHNDTIRLIVEDNGVGFAPDEYPEPRGDGRGLGLVGMRERAELLGGSVEIESAPGNGTTIFASIPRELETGHDP